MEKIYQAMIYFEHNQNHVDGQVIGLKDNQITIALFNGKKVTMSKQAFNKSIIVIYDMII